MKVFDTKKADIDDVDFCLEIKISKTSLSRPSDLPTATQLCGVLSKATRAFRNVSATATSLRGVDTKVVNINNIIKEFEQKIKNWHKYPIADCYAFMLYILTKLPPKEISRFGSYYVVDEYNGSYRLRIATHNAKSVNFSAKNENYKIGVTFKSADDKNTFESNKDIFYKEHVYYTEHLTSDTLKEILQGIVNVLKGGLYNTPCDLALYSPSKEKYIEQFGECGLDGYTTRDNGTALSENAAEAEREGKFSAGTFRQMYKVAKADFEVLEKLKIIINTEWHHTGKNYKRTDFFGWDDYYKSDYSNANIPLDSYADIYSRNKKEIGKLVKRILRHDFAFIERNAQIEKENEKIKSNNLQKDCAEIYCIKLCKMFGFDDERSYNCAISYRKSVEIEQQKAEERRKLQGLDGNGDYYELFDDDNNSLVSYGTGDLRHIKKRAKADLQERGLKSGFIEITDFDGDIKDTIDIALDGLDGIDEDFADKLNEFILNGYKLTNRHDCFSCGYPQEVLQLCDLNANIEIVITQDGMRKILGQKKGKQDVAHDLTQIEILRLPQLLREPILVINGNTRKSRLVFIEIPRARRKVFAIINVDFDMILKGKRNYYNLVASAYSSEDKKISEKIRMACAKNEVWYYDSRKIKNWLSAMGELQLLSLLEANSLYSDKDISELICKFKQKNDITNNNLGNLGVHKKVKVNGKDRVVFVRISRDGDFFNEKHEKRHSREFGLYDYHTYEFFVNVQIDDCTYKAIKRVTHGGGGLHYSYRYNGKVVGESDKKLVELILTENEINHSPQHLSGVSDEQMEQYQKEIARYYVPYSWSTSDRIYLPDTNLVFGKVKRIASHLSTEQTKQLLDFLRAKENETYSKYGKHIFTDRHSVWKLADYTAEVEKKNEEIASRKDVTLELTNCNVELSYTDDRLRVLFSGMPSYEQRNSLKHAVCSG